MNSLRTIVESKILPYIQQPMRYAGSEINSIRKNPDDCTVHGVLCFPDLYEIGMSNFGSQILYHIVNSRDRWVLSRSFRPAFDMEKQMRACGVPLYTLEYFTPIKNADWLGFSIQYELQYTNILAMLDLAGIAVKSCERGDNDPVVIAGGPCVGNPEPMGQYIDFFAIGDGEKLVEKICEVIEAGKKNGLSRNNLLKELSAIDGLYQPSVYTRVVQSGFLVPEKGPQVRAAKIKELETENYPSKPIVPLIEVVHHRLSVEVMRGCTRGCRFCAAGMWYRPVRERGASDIIKSIQDGIGNTGWRDAGLLSLSTADYTCLSSLLGSIRQIKEQSQVGISLPSTRLDALTDQQLDYLDAVSPLTSLTVAPEAGSERLRKVINKDFSDEMIYTVIDRLLKRNINTLKLYFMIGLPTETAEDIQAITTMTEKISGMMRAVSGRKEIHVALSPFSPKAHTPFQWEEMLSVEELELRSRQIKSSCRHLKNVKVSYRDPKVTLLETIMARGDYRVGDLIYQAWRKGAGFDGWDEHFNINLWNEAAAETGIDMLSYCKKLQPGQLLPWNKVSSGIDEAFMLKEREAAFAEQNTGDCRNGCQSCGVCSNGLSMRFSEPQPMVVFKPGSTNVKSGKISWGYRIQFSKGASLRYLGHLDMASILNRAFLMAGVSLAYSNGYNPHPKISFGPPLPLGVFGSREELDIVTNEPLREIESINRLLPQDLTLLDFKPLNDHKNSLFNSINCAEYLFAPLLDLNPDLIEDTIGRFLGLEKINLKIEKGGKTVEKDIRAGVRSIDIEPGSSVFKAELMLGAGKSCKPLELIAALFPQNRFADFLVERLICKSVGNLL
ncbi:MAG TPA: TIGR03960 family B12-binding radical SAM protein [Chitinispirillaceae bacterium]|nr:TIGR03960 family B12-binding radical SAM protein [Chitinispirillaceae bacterium]